MPDELRTSIERAAFSNGRTVTKEINIRLEHSLEQAKAPGIAPVPHKVEQERAPYGNGTISELDKAMLAVFRAMPVEKQLALLSLFK